MQGTMLGARRRRKSCMAWMDNIKTWTGLPVEGKGKGKVFPYSLPSVGPGADPGVQAVSPQVT